MATGGVLERSSGNTNDDFRHTCGLCMEPYKGRQPKLLPCFHTFCLPCLTALAESASIQTPRSKATGEGRDEKAPEQIVQEDSGETTEQTEEGGQEKNVEKGQCGEESVTGDGVCTQPVVFLCPTCRRPVTLPEGGVTQLQSNFYLDHDGADDTSRTVSCDLCLEEDRKQDATHACQECGMNICRSCRRYHDKFPGGRDHHVTPVGQCDLRVTPQPERKLCQNHPDQSCCLFCQKCDVAICLLCKLTSHEGHVTVDMAVASKQAKQDVDGLKVKINEQIRVLGSLLERLDNDERQLARKKQDVTREVSTRYDVAVTWLTQARDDVMHALTSKEQTSLQDLQAERASAIVAMKTLQAAQSRANCVLNCGPDVVHVKTELQAVLLDDVTIRRHGDRAAREGEATAFFCKCEEGVDEDLLRDYVGHVRDGNGDTSVKNITAHMTDLETKMVAVNVELDKTTAAVASNIEQIADLKTEVASLKAELTKAATEIASVDNENSDLKSEVTVLKVELTKTATDTVSTSGKVDKLTSTVDSLTLQLSSLSDKAQKAVFFHAMLTTDPNNYSGPGFTIIFANVMSNMGDGYDPKTSVFTAPVTGTYLFLATWGNESSSAAEFVYIDADGTSSARACASKESVGSCHLVVKLDAGKQVCVKRWLPDNMCNYGSGRADCYLYNPYKDSSFTGVLISN